jgi:hypothetical protein
LIAEIKLYTKEGGIIMSNEMKDRKKVSTTSVKSESTRSNLGSWGWSMILFCGICYFISGALNTNGLNSLHPLSVACGDGIERRFCPFPRMVVG